jgi:hypothetical protein
MKLIREFLLLRKSKIISREMIIITAPIPSIRGCRYNSGKIKRTIPKDKSTIEVIMASRLKLLRPSKIIFPSFTPRFILTNNF